MTKTSKYCAREMDANGRVVYPLAEHRIWRTLYRRQRALVATRACDAYLSGLQQLAMPEHRIPQLPDIDAVLFEATGWRTAGVSALISFDKFFALLANQRFPVATFIRSAEEVEYLQEPDIFHEIFGHCPLLTNPSFAHFTHHYGKMGQDASHEERIFLARLYWFTVEFGLLNTPDGMRIYGGGILSSPGETAHALTPGAVEHRAFDLVEVLRTPYRIDIMQPIYYVLDNVEQLFDIGNMDVLGAIKKARALGLFSPTYPSKHHAR